MDKFYEFEVVYHVLGVRLHRVVVAQDEIQAWLLVKSQIISRQHWLEVVHLIGEVPRLRRVV